MAGLAAGLATGTPIMVTAQRPDGAEIRFTVRADVRSPAEADLLRRGGMFQAALARLAAAAPERVAAAAATP
jgi:aconitase A